MNTREALRHFGVDARWRPRSVTLLVGTEQKKIVCDPVAFRWLDKVIRFAAENGLDEELGVSRDRSERTVPAEKTKRSRRRDPDTDDRFFQNGIEDEFAHGSFIIHGVSRYPGEDAGGEG